MPSTTRQCSFELDPRGFVRATINRGAEMTLHDAEEALTATVKEAGGKRTAVLVDTRGVRSQTREAREYFAGEAAAAACLAVAILTGSPVSRVIADFFLRYTPQRIPTRMFTDERAAIDWLLSVSQG